MQKGSFRIIQRPPACGQQGTDHRQIAVQLKKGTLLLSICALLGSAGVKYQADTEKAEKGILLDLGSVEPQTIGDHSDTAQCHGERCKDRVQLSEKAGHEV